jgi:hypothetical protein
MRKYFLLIAITAVAPMLYTLPGEAQTTSTTSATTTVSKTRPVLRIRKPVVKRRYVKRAAVNSSTSTSASTSATGTGSSVQVKTETQITK